MSKMMIHSKTNIKQTLNVKRVLFDLEFEIVLRKMHELNENS